MILAQLSAFGTNAGSIWYFAVGIFAFLVITCLIIMAVSLIKSLID